MAVHADAAPAVIVNPFYDTTGIFVHYHGIIDEIRRNRSIPIEKLLEHRNLLHIVHGRF